MNTADSIEVVNRFFAAVETLRRDKYMRGLKSFSRRYGVNDRNIWLQRREPERNIFQPAWLSYLVRDYAVSATWLLTGEGEFYDSEKKKGLAPQKNRNRRKSAAEGDAV